MIDIHSHLLPGIDDGAKNMEESLEIINLYMNKGVKAVIATPHYIDGSYSKNRQENIKALEILSKELVHKKIDFKVYLGNEVYIVPNLLELLEKNIISTMANSKYVLVELPMRDIPIYFMDVLYEMQLSGYIPIIAHPERNLKIQENPDILKDALNNGAFAQLNLPSLLGLYGSPSMNMGNIFLENGYYDFIGTDTHNVNDRSPNNLKALEILKSKLREDEYNKIVYENAKKILRNEMIGDKKLESVNNKKTFLKDIKKFFRR